MKKRNKRKGLKRFICVILLLLALLSMIAVLKKGNTGGSGSSSYKTETVQIRINAETIVF